MTQCYCVTFCSFSDSGVCTFEPQNTGLESRNPVSLVVPDFDVETEGIDTSWKKSVCRYHKLRSFDIMQVSRAHVVSEKSNNSMNRLLFCTFSLDRNLTKFKISFRWLKQGVFSNFGGVIQSWDKVWCSAGATLLMSTLTVGAVLG